MRPSRRGTLGFVLLMAALGGGALCWRSLRKRADGEVLVLGLWDRAVPLLDRLASERGVRLEGVALAELGRRDLADAWRLRPAPRLVLVLNAPVERTAEVERLVRSLVERGSRAVILDSRDWQEGLVKARVLEKDANLSRYWRYGGERNLGNMLDHVASRYLGAHRDVAPPSPVPTDGLYHPDAADVFGSLAAYRRWYDHARRVPAGAPRAAYVVHASFITLGETADIDAIIHALEKKGIGVYPVFVQDEQGLRSTLLQLGPDLLLTQRHIGLGRPADGSAPLPLTLGVPYLKPISALTTTVAEWRERPEGLLPGDMAGQVVVQELDGTIEPLVVSALATSGEYRTQAPIAERVERFAARAASWVALQRTAAEDKRLAVVFYNTDLGGDSVARGSVSGMFLDAPRSIVRFVQALRSHGYRAEPPSSPVALVDRLRKEGRNFGPWAQDEIDSLARGGTAVLVKLADYERWMEQDLTESQRRALVGKHGPAPGKLMVTAIHGEPEIVIPRVRLGPNVSLFPQPEKGARQDTRLVHDQTVPPSHQYVAFYLWLRHAYRPAAIVHFGTHGTLELLPRRAAGLGPEDFADALLGATPNINPWILDNVAEATLARRRAYAVLVDHLVPPIERTEANEALRRLHDDVDREQALEPGPVRDAFGRKVVATLEQTGFAHDLLDARRGDTLPEAALRELDLRLHALMEEQAPRTLHVLGEAPPDDRRPGFVASILGRSAIARLGGRDRSDAAVRCALAPGGTEAGCTRDLPEAVRPAAERDLTRARRVDADLGRAPDEIAHLVDALDGRYVPPGPGNDPVRNPAALPTGRNLYALDPEEVPTGPAEEVARAVVSQMLEAFRKKHGRPPRKLAINLNGFETMRDTGVTEAQALLLVGAEPVRDERGLVTDVRLRSREALGRPRVDVVLAISGAYRDNFATRVRLLDRALRLAQSSPEPDNPLRQDTIAAAERLRSKGVPADRADRLARMRIFGQPPGQFGTQILYLVPRSGAWENRSEVARVYRENMRFAYGEDAWGVQADDAFAAAVDGTEAVSHVWASNMMSPLTNHHVYEYVGGLSLAVEQATGKRPDSLIADVRDPTAPRSRSLDEVVSSELQVRLLNERWIRDMQDSGYAGGGHVAAYVENLFGWESTVPGSVGERAFEQVDELYLRDAKNLGTRRWLEETNPDALLSVTATLLESARRGYYHPDAQALGRLVADYMRQVAERGPPTGLMGGGNEALASYVQKVYEAPGSLVPRSAAAAYRRRVARSASDRMQASRSLSAGLSAARARAGERARARGVVKGRLMRPAPRPAGLGAIASWAAGVAAALLLGGVVAGLFRGRPRRRMDDTGRRTGEGG